MSKPRWASFLLALLVLSSCSSLGEGDLATWEAARGVDPLQAGSPQGSEGRGSTSNSAQDLVNDVPTTAPPVQGDLGNDLIGGVGFEIVALLPHDPGVATAGLAYYDGSLVEATSSAEESSRRILDPGTGDLETTVVADGATVPDEDRPLAVGGIAVWQNLVLHVSRSGREAIVADPESLEELDRFTFDGVAAGICAFAEEMAVSDGGATIAFRDPMSFTTVRTIEVFSAAEPVGLTELACADDQLWAVVPAAISMARIDVVTGEVVATVDLASLVPDGLGPESITGLAYRPTTTTFFLTGNGWPSLVEVRLATPG